MVEWCPTRHHMMGVDESMMVLVKWADRNRKPAQSKGNGCQTGHGQRDLPPDSHNGQTSESEQEQESHPPLNQHHAPDEMALPETGHRLKARSYSADQPPVLQQSKSFPASLRPERELPRNQVALSRLAGMAKTQAERSLPARKGRLTEGTVGDGHAGLVNPRIVPLPVTPAVLHPSTRDCQTPLCTPQRHPTTATR